MKKRLLLSGLIIVFTLTSGCQSKYKAKDLLKGYQSKKINYRQQDDQFIEAVADFSLRLFQNTLSSSQDNTVISPLSALLSLSMTANGADKETLAEMEQVLANGIAISVFNEYLATYVNELLNKTGIKLEIANSVWIKDQFPVAENFLQTVVDYYRASVFHTPFDQTTIKDINNWVKNNTDKMIEKIIEKIDASLIMFLINTILFDAMWNSVFVDVVEDYFTDIDNNKQLKQFMRSIESNYIKGENVTGFIKNYKNNAFSFMALLPEEDINIEQFVFSLTGDDFVNLSQNRQSESVFISLPKFQFEYQIDLIDALKNIGINNAFDDFNADFSNINKYNKLFISEVKHAVAIAIDENGTKAAAVTSTGVSLSSAPEYKHYLSLNRPFVFAIIDNNCNLPLFIGTLTN